MIAKLSGQLAYRFDHSVVIDVAGVGYELQCPVSVAEGLGEIGGQVSVFVHTHYKTDGVSLYGFESFEQRALFLKLLKVDSVGPKSALQILQIAHWSALVEVINSGDVAGLTALGKISKKTAELVAVKLKGKLEGLKSSDVRLIKSEVPRGAKNEVFGMLQHLGYKPNEIEKTLSHLEEDIWEQDVQTIIRHALGGLAGT